MRIYNTLSAKKEEFSPLAEPVVTMYVCGPTVYDYMHIGNARTFVLFDAAARYLKYKGFSVVVLRNYTDIDDRIINKAALEGASITEIANRYIKAARDDLALLNCEEPAFTPRVTEQLPEIISMIQTLIDKGFAYEKNGSVFYDTAAFSRYGALSKKKSDDLIAGARVDVNTDKKNPADFVLWKPAKDGEAGYASAWGLGRPGWHIECSAMAKEYLGDTIDIHAGGEDLIFPHHENEIAQSEAANGCTFARVWLHAKHLFIDNQKMAKSAGNFRTLRDVAQNFSPAVIRFYLLSSHYRSSLNFSEELLQAAQNGYNRIKNCLVALEHITANSAGCVTEPQTAADADIARYKADFIRAMDDDFNTADALAAIFELVKFANIKAKEEPINYAAVCASAIIELCGILGLTVQTPSGETAVNAPADPQIQRLIDKRAAAKAARDFAGADAIRKELLEMGITIEDTRQGTRWTRA